MSALTIKFQGEPSMRAGADSFSVSGLELYANGAGPVGHFADGRWRIIDGEALGDPKLTGMSFYGYDVRVEG